LVWRRIEKTILKTASEIAQATAVDFSQLLDMVATSFPKTEDSFLQLPIRKT